MHNYMPMNILVTWIIKGPDNRGSTEIVSGSRHINFLSRHRSAETYCSRRRTDRTWYVRSAKCTRVEVQSA